MPDAAAVTELRNQLEATRQQYNDFRAATRREILYQHFEAPGGWCQYGTHDVLEQLGLPPMTTTISGYAHIRISIDSVGGAANEDEARARIISAIDVTNNDPEISYKVSEIDPVLDAYVTPDPTDETTHATL